MNYNIIDKIIHIQRFLKSKLYRLISSQYQTKEWRKIQYWYTNGKHNECEKYQKNIIKYLLNVSLNNTNERLNISTHNIVNIRNIMKLDYGFDMTENFDGKLILNQKNILF
jgi:hypothetical protein